jgi:hypothetical protein
MPGHPFGQAAELCFLMDSRLSLHITTAHEKPHTYATYRSIIQKKIFFSTAEGGKSNLPGVQIVSLISQTVFTAAVI